MKRLADIYLIYLSVEIMHYNMKKLTDFSLLSSLGQKAQMKGFCFIKKNYLVVYLKCWSEPAREEEAP